MSALEIILCGGAVLVASGIFALALALVRARGLASLVAVIGAVTGGAVGLWGALSSLHAGSPIEIAASWPVPGGALILGVDPLSAFFLAPLFVLGALCAVYGRGYLGARPAAAAGLNLFIASIALVLVARHALLFLIAWESMTLLAYLLITLEHGEAHVRRAGWAYLIASHVAITALLAMFLALAAPASGALDFASFANAWRGRSEGAAIILGLALVGFGVKAGVVGLHVWLPEAHAAAPSHVSALMSGVLIKIGIYGILRAAILVTPGAWFGATLICLGAFGALFGVTLAIYQRDIKRVLAYSSVENVGIILLGLGLGLWARARGDAELSAIALAGGLLHIWNHAAMKGLMFLGAGSVLHGAGTKDIERLGGLLRRMPWTGQTMILGAVAIAALPPLNGFVGEWLLYRALARAGLSSHVSFSLVALAGTGALALVGGLSALCFVRLIGIALLGSPRSEGAARAHESPPAMIGPMTVLAAACLAGSIAAPLLVSAQSPLLAQIGGQSDAAGAPMAASIARLLYPLVIVNAALCGAIALATALLARRVRGAERSGTWGCGYAAPSTRMQYTGRAFSELFTSRALPRWVRASLRVEPPRGIFPSSASFSTNPDDPLTRHAYEPFLVRWGDRFKRLGFLQRGSVHIYIVYIVVTVVIGLGWTAARGWLSP